VALNTITLTLFILTVRFTNVGLSIRIVMFRTVPNTWYCMFYISMLKIKYHWDRTLNIAIQIRNTKSVKHSMPVRWNTTKSQFTKWIKHQWNIQYQVFGTTLFILTLRFTNVGLSIRIVMFRTVPNTWYCMFHWCFIHLVNCDFVVFHLTAWAISDNINSNPIEGEPT
jgi:hypothetical protein